MRSLSLFSVSGKSPSGPSGWNSPGGLDGLEGVPGSDVKSGGNSVTFRSLSPSDPGLFDFHLLVLDQALVRKFLLYSNSKFEIT